MIIIRVCSSIALIRVVSAFVPPLAVTTKRSIFSATTTTTMMASTTDTQSQVPPADPINDIRKLLQSVKYDGYHFANGIIQNPRLNDLPAIQIDNFQDRITYPITPQEAKQLITKASPSPFGLGEKTIIDPKIRKSWEFEPHQVNIDPHWNKTLDEILIQVNKGLGVSTSASNSNQVKAVFHKLLIYEEGCFFKRHADSKKLDGMFGTLSIQLPSLFEGGSFKFEHLSYSDDVDLSIDSETSLKWTAWYADTFHEVEPLKCGYRVALVYNLVRVIPSSVVEESSSSSFTTMKAEKDENDEEDRDSSLSSFDYLRLLPELKEKVQEWQLAVSKEEEEKEEGSALGVDVGQEKNKNKEGDKESDDDDAEQHAERMIKASNKKMIAYKLDHMYPLPGPLPDGAEKYAQDKRCWGDFKDEISRDVAVDHQLLDGGVPSSEFMWIDRLNGRDRNVALLLCRAAAQNMLNVSLVLQDLYIDRENDEYDEKRCHKFETLKVLKNGTTEELPWLFGKEGENIWRIIHNYSSLGKDDYLQGSFWREKTVQCVPDEDYFFGNNGVAAFDRYRMGFLLIEAPTIVDAKNGASVGQGTSANNSLA